MSKKPEKITRTSVDTILFTREDAEGWKLPPFQRPLKVNQKVIDASKDIQESGGVIPGVLTLGKINNVTYKLDGQHRIHAALMTELPEFYADVRIAEFDSMAEMGEEFVKLNSSLVKLKPDDILRGLEASTPALGQIRRACPYVGYDMIRRNDRAPILSMSMLIKAWNAAGKETPQSGGTAASVIVDQFTTEEVDQLITFLTLCWHAWGRDEQTKRLWSAINLTLCAWIYRHQVIATIPSASRVIKLSNSMFEKCLMGLSSNEKYLDWLVGRVLNDTQRSPCYNRIKDIFAARIMQETKSTKKPLFLQPPWAPRGGGFSSRGYT